MKVFVSIVFLLSSSLYAQQSSSLEKESLPEEIKEYYYNLNLANSFSTQSERSILTKYLDTHDIKQQPDSKRLIFVMNLLNDIRKSQLEEWNTMLNKFNSSPTNSPYINEVQFYKKSEELISVRIKTYQISESDNFKILSSE